MYWVLISTILLCVPVKAGRGQSGDLNSSTPGLGLPPLLTAALAFYIICAILAATQVVLLAHNTTRRLSKELPSIALPQKYAGPIFPIFLLLASLTFMVFNVIEASSLATTNKFNLPLIGRPELTQSYSTAAAVMGYLADILLVSCAFVLLAHREKILRITSPMACRIKMAYDAILTVVLFALSMARVGLKAVAVTSAEVRVSNNVYLAYHYTLLVTVANIALSSIILHIRTKRSRVDDHKVCQRFISRVT